MVRWVVVILLSLVSFVTIEPLYAQLILDHDTYIDIEESESPQVDNSLFRLYDLNGADLYEEINRYLYSPISILRRGVDWWNLRRITSIQPSANKTFDHPTLNHSIRAFCSTRDYAIGGSAQWGAIFNNGWSLTSSLWGRTGRDANVEGVFQQYITPSLQLSREFDAHHYFTLNVETPYQMRGLRSSATQECYDLTHDNLYNPLWGYYHGDVRNSRVVRNFVPSLYGRYQRPLSDVTTSAIEISCEYGTRRVSRLGWYNSSNPTPNYYSKLPSYYVGTSAYDEVNDSWQQNDTQYTQIAWDRLEQINLMSSDGESHYVVEDRVERVADIEAKVLFSTQITERLSVEYGALLNLSSRRKYKQMRDLLGGEYLLDIDQYAGDFVQTGNELQNNLRSPNRKITQGDRFGYDFSYLHSEMGALVSVDYCAPRIDMKIAANITELSLHRDGHYEKERFPGSGSYGDSQKIELSEYNFSAFVEYAIAAKHYVSGRFCVDASSPLSRYMFIAEESSNRIVDSPTTEKIASVELSYRYSTPMVSLLLHGYLISSYDMSQVWQGYDDISSTYSNIVISDIATQSLGVEVSAKINILRNLSLTATLACGGYTYTSAPLVKLYDETDMSPISESRASSLGGYIVGNTPQLSATAGCTLFARRGFILSPELAFYAMRYISPSIIRRTDRVLATATSGDILHEMVAQERVPDLFNINFSISKSFKIRNKHSIYATLQIDNLLGQRDIISYAREGNRVLSNSASGVSYSYSPQSSTYQYAVGRTLYLSLRYSF
ncbi:MAG: hypothetical protein SNG10_02275 [Rikenellaceae bacterium]